MVPGGDALVWFALTLSVPINTLCVRQILKFITQMRVALSEASYGLFLAELAALDGG